MPLPLELRWMALYCRACSQQLQNRQECERALLQAEGRVPTGEQEEPISMSVEIRPGRVPM